jgi:hypothetical protein
MSATTEAPQAGPEATGATGWALPPWWEKALFPLFLLAAILFSYFGLQRRRWQQGGGD